MTLHCIDSGDYDAEKHRQWSIEGMAGLYGHPEPSSAPERLKRLLPPLPEPWPFAVDVCGYVVMTQPVPPGTYGKGRDAAGRNVFIVGDLFLFSRHGGDSFYVYAQTWEAGARPTSYERVPAGMWLELLAAAEKAKDNGEKSPDAGRGRKLAYSPGVSAQTVTAAENEEPVELTVEAPAE